MTVTKSKKEQEGQEPQGEQEPQAGPEPTAAQQEQVEQENAERQQEQGEPQEGGVSEFEAANQWTPGPSVSDGSTPPEDQAANLDLGGKDIQYLPSESSDEDVEAVKGTQDEGQQEGQEENSTSS